MKIGIKEIEMDNIRRVWHKRSSEKNADNTPKRPTTDDIEYGEIAFNLAEGVETLFVRNANDKIVGTSINGTVEKTSLDLLEHTKKTDNPHNVTKEQVGLGNVDNTADLEKPVSNSTQALLNQKLEKTAVVDNLTTNDSTQALSAAQGIELKKRLETVSGGITADLSNLISRVTAVEEEVENTETIEDGIITKQESMIADFAN